MENYSRKNKTANAKEEKTPTRHHIKKGLSAFQKTLATIGSILGIITATITILTFMNNNKSDTKTKSSQTTQTTIIKENVKILLKYSTTHRTVLVSNCRQDRVLETLSYHGLTDKFTNLFYRDTTIVTQKISKYQNAINLLGISPDNVVAFENEQTEIAGAGEAGIKVINPQISL